MLYGNQVKEISLKHVQGKAARDILSAIIEWTGNKINTAKKRWIFELLQNAIDTATGRKNENLKIEIEKSEQGITFKHNAGCFKQEEIAAVFYGGSTKPFEPQSEYLGRFGTGFLVTHVLSRKVTIKAFFLDNLQNILTCPSIIIDRTGTNEIEISGAIDNCFDQLNNATVAESQVDYWTEFIYDIDDERGKNAMDIGIDIFKRCLPLIFAFNDVVKSITIDGTLYEPEYSKIDVIEAVKVKETIFYFLNENGIHVGLLADNNQVSLLDEVPRIFLGMPLVETANLIKIPFIINSRKLAPTERRDALDSNQNINQEILIAASRLYKSFLNHLLTIHDLHSKYNCLRIEDIPQNLQEQNPLWKTFNDKLKEVFLEILNQTPIVKTDDTILPLNDVYFPANLNEIDDESLLEGFYELAKCVKPQLPDWENCSEWLALVKELKVIFPVDNRIYNILSLRKDLLNFISTRKTFPSFEDLAEHFKLVDAKRFFLDFYVYADKLYEKEILHNDFCENLLPDQSGNIGTLKRQWSNSKISFTLLLENKQNPFKEDLKDIISLIGRNIRDELTHQEFVDFKIVKEYVREEMTMEKIFQTILSPPYKLKDKVGKWDDKATGWVNLFCWNINNDIDLPDDFPVITKSNEVESVNRRFLVPFTSMNIDEKFEEIFPDKRILNRKYFEKSDFTFLEKLNRCNYVITSLPVYTSNAMIKLEKLRSILNVSNDEISNVDHKLESDSFSISEIPFWGELIGKISDSIDRAKVFFGFVFEYLSEKDKNWTSKFVIKCTCSQGSHNVAPSLWLAGLKTDKWVPVGFINEDNTEEIERRQASKESIEKLFSAEEFEKLINQRRETAMELLPHLGFDGLDLKIKIQSIETGRPEETLRKEITVLTDINQRFPNLANLSANDPEGVENALIKLEEQRKKDFLKSENKRIGENVELIIRQIVKARGLKVQAIHKGGDMEIWSENENDWDSGAIEINVDRHRYILESKFTSGSAVHLSPAQSDSARIYEENYLVLVVKSIPGLRDRLKENIQEEDDQSELQDVVIKNSRVIQKVFTKLGQQPNINEVEIDLNGYWLKQKLWQEGENIFDWLIDIASQNSDS